MTRRTPGPCVEALEDRAVPALIGALDPSFSPNAPAGVTDVVATRQFVDVAVQQDGKLVAVSDDSGDFFVTRFNVDGSLDTAFGTGGVKTIDVQGAAQADAAFAVVIDAQNRIVVVGSGGAAITNFALVRLSADGQTVQLNTSVHVGDAGVDSVPRDVALQTDGTIVAAGTASVGGDTDFALVRFDGTTGAVIGAPITQTLGTGDEVGRGVAVYPSGPNVNKIVIVGDTGTAGNAAFGIIQRNADGTLDATFNVTGQQIIDPTAGNDTARGVAVTASGSVVVAGNNGAGDVDLVVAQLLPTGALDPAFNGGAVRTITKAGADFVRFHPLAIQADGKIVVVGDSNTGVDVGVFRLNANGTTDTGFGTAGDGTFDVNGNDDANAVTIDNAGRIVIAGDDGTSQGFLARVTATTGLPTAVAVSGPASGAVRVNVNNGSVLTEAPINTGTPLANTVVNTAVADVNGDGTPDLVVGANTGGPRVIVLDGRDGTGNTKLADFLAFTGYAGGVFVAAGDLNGDGKAEVIVTPVVGGVGPRVAVFGGASLTAGTSNPTKLADFLGIADAITGAADNSAGTIALVGARVAVGDANGDGIADIVVAAGSNGGPRVTIWDGRNVATAPGAGTPAAPPLANAFVFEDTQRDGAFVALGDVTGDGRADLIAGGGPNGGARVRIGDMAAILAAKNFGQFDAALGVQKSNFIVNEAQSRGGIRVAARDLDGDGIADLITGSGAGLRSQVNVFKGTRLVTLTSGIVTGDQTFDPFGAVLADGVYVG